MKQMLIAFVLFVASLPLTSLASSPQVPATFSRVELQQAWEGNVSAQAKIGLIYLLGPKPDYGQAAMWLSMAAAQGDARSQYELSRLYADGRGVPKIPAVAAELCGKAAAQGLAKARHCP